MIQNSRVKPKRLIFLVGHGTSSLRRVLEEGMTKCVSLHLPVSSFLFNITQVLDTLIVFFAVLVARDPADLADLAERTLQSSPLPISEKGKQKQNEMEKSPSSVVDTLFSLLRVYSSSDPLALVSPFHTDRTVQDAELKKMGLQKKDRTLVSQCFPLYCAFFQLILPGLSFERYIIPSSQDHCYFLQTRPCVYMSLLFLFTTYVTCLSADIYPIPHHAYPSVTPAFPCTRIPPLNTPRIHPYHRLSSSPSVFPFFHILARHSARHTLRQYLLPPPHARYVPSWPMGRCHSWSQ